MFKMKWKEEYWVTLKNVELIACVNLDLCSSDSNIMGCKNGKTGDGLYQAKLDHSFLISMHWGN